jgi:hypothetical protein
MCMSSLPSNARRDIRDAHCARLKSATAHISVECFLPSDTQDEEILGVADEEQFQQSGRCVCS